MKKHLLKISVFIILFLGTAVVSYAGMGSMGHAKPCGGPFPPCPLPLDGGVSFLLLAGAAYGGKKVYDKTVKTKS